MEGELVLPMVFLPGDVVRHLLDNTRYTITRIVDECMYEAINLSGNVIIVYPDEITSFI